MEHIRKFQELLVTQKIMILLEQEIGLKDKTLAEFILNLAKSASTASDFERLLTENGADFTIDLMNSLYAMITRVMPDISRSQLQQVEAAKEEMHKPHYHSAGVYENLD
jgi:ATP-dependent RNA helicase DHX8/PRP22